MSTIAHPVVRAWYRAMSGSVPYRGDVVSMRMAAMAKSSLAARLLFENQYEGTFFSIFAVTGQTISREYTNKRVVSDVVLEDQMLAPMREVLRMLYYFVERQFGENALSLLRKDVSWATWDPTTSRALQAWNRQRIAQNISNIAKITKRRIQKTISDGVLKRQSVETVANLLRQQFDFSRQRARAIAQTEVNAAANAGSRFSVAANIGSPETLSRIWVSAGDTRTRVSHVKATGQRRKFNEPYDIGSSKLLFPGDLSLGASAREVIRCRCFEYYVR